MVKNSIVLVAPGTPKLTFDAGVAANSAPIAFYTDDTGSTKVADVIPGPTGGRLQVAAGQARLLAGSIAAVPGVINQYTVDLEVTYTHTYAGLLTAHKPIVLQGITVDVNAGGAVTGCQLAPKVRTIGCEATYPNTGVGALVRTHYTGTAAPASDACQAPAIIGGNYTITCKAPGYTLGGCSSANLQLVGGSVTNVTIIQNGCGIPTAAANGSTKIFITCIGNN
jgi:hypothetical protein